MKLYFLASGSKGNASLIVSGKTVILVDFGMTKKRMVELLSKTPYQLSHITAFFLTHEHSDHGAGKDFIPLEKRYASATAFEVLPENALTHGHVLTINEVTVTVFPLSHDAKDPLGFIFEDGQESLVYITDTGYVSEKNITLCHNKTYYLMESNHNVKMLLQTDRSQDTKVRILGDSGHLSNEDSAYYFSRMMGPNTKAVYLAHLSEEANTPELAAQTYQKVLQKLRIPFKHLQIIPTLQWDVLEGGED